MKYRRVEIVEAYRLGDEPPPDWFRDTVDKQGRIWADFGRSVRVCTPTGVQSACEGDYIVRGAHGALYMHKPDSFCETYEPVEGDQHGED